MSSGNQVLGNFIGTDVTGTADLGNSFYGVLVHDAPNNVVGASGAGNVVSGNDSIGIYVFGNQSSGNLLQGNFVGTNATGTAALRNNTYGVLIQNAPNDLVGGTTSGSRNVISGNGFYGVRIFGAPATGNKVQGNFIGTDAVGNAALGNFIGVDISSGPLDADTGPNNLQNFPVIRAVKAGTETRVVGKLNSLANATYTLDFYASTTADTSAYGEGERWLGSISITTDGDGNSSFDSPLPETRASRRAE